MDSTHEACHRRKTLSRPRDWKTLVFRQKSSTFCTKDQAIRLHCGSLIVDL